METFQTGAADPGRRLKEWNQIANTTFGEIEIAAIDKSAFNARMLRRRAASLTLASVISSPARVQGARSPAGRVEGHFLLLNERGSSLVSQDRREANLRPGELTVIDSGEPYSIAFDQPNHMTVLHIPTAQCDIDWDSQSLRPQSAEDIPLLVSLLRHLARDAAPLDRLNETGLFGRLLQDVLTVTWPQRPAAQRRDNEVMAHWDRRIDTLVKQRLGEADLDARAIGAGLGISARYVQKVLARRGMTVSAYLMEQRLKTAASRLREDPGAQITDVAFDAGFNDLSHFCRSFKARFGCSAREWRAGRA
jgi:AraC-like DNA-binding protein